MSEQEHQSEAPLHVNKDTKDTVALGRLGCLQCQAVEPKILRPKHCTRRRTRLSSQDCASGFGGSRGLALMPRSSVQTHLCTCGRMSRYDKGQPCFLLSLPPNTAWYDGLLSNGSMLVGWARYPCLRTAASQRRTATRLRNGPRAKEPTRNEAVRIAILACDLLDFAGGGHPPFLCRHGKGSAQAPARRASTLRLFGLSLPASLGVERHLRLHSHSQSFT